MLQKLRSIFGGKTRSPADPRELFATEVGALLQSLPSVKDVKRAPDAFAFDLVTSAGTRRVHLDNAFAESREMSPEQRLEKIELFFASVGADEQVSVLRGATYCVEMSLKQPTAAFARRPFLPYIDQIVAMDLPTSMSFVSRATVERWDVKESEVFVAADARVPLLASANVELYDDTYGPLWIVTSNDSYESSRLLVPGWLASFRGKVEGNPIAIVPERGTLMVGGDSRSEMVERLLDKAEREVVASNRRLSPALYTANARVPSRKGASGADECAVTRRIFSSLVLFAVLSTSCHRKENVVLVDTIESKFHVGQKWNYRTRPGEEKSSLTIVKVESWPKLGVIVHVSLDGLRIKSPHSPSGFSETISHMPFAESAMEKSVTTLAVTRVPLPAFEEGYQEWRRAFDAGKGGVFTITVAEGVEFIQAALNK